MEKTKTCKTCKETKSVKEFFSTGYNRSRTTGERLSKNYKPACKICHSKMQKDRCDSYFEELGVVWKCIKCGYDKCRAALDFHHRDGPSKDFVISGRTSISLESLRKEVDKCDILCANCHREHHAGIS